MNKEDLEDAIEKGVLKAFKTLGLDVANPHEVQRDFLFLRSFRQGTQSWSNKAGLAVFSGMVLALVGFIWAGFKGALGGGN